MSEGWLAGYLRHVTGRLRAGLSPELRRELEQRDELDRRQLLSSGTAAAEEVALPARQTGDAAWLAARGEDGSGVARASGGTGAGGAAAVKPPGTRYRLAKDEHLAAASPRRLCGGAVRASGENAPGEAAQRAFDGSPTTKWLDFGKEGAWLEYRLPAEQPQAVLAAYALTSANDSPERDPRHVMLEAWDKGGRSLCSACTLPCRRMAGAHAALHTAYGVTAAGRVAAPACRAWMPPCLRAAASERCCCPRPAIAVVGVQAGAPGSCWMSSAA